MKEVNCTFFMMESLLPLLFPFLFCLFPRMGHRGCFVVSFCFC